MFLFRPENVESDQTRVFTVLVREEALPDGTGRFGRPFGWGDEPHQYYLVGHLFVLRHDDDGDPATEWFLVARPGVRVDEIRQLRQKKRSEFVERSFAHVCETGGGRRTWLRGLADVTKRYVVQVAAHNLGLLMRKLFGVGKPRVLQGGGGSVWVSWCRYWRSGLQGGRRYAGTGILRALTWAWGRRPILPKRGMFSTVC